MRLYALPLLAALIAAAPVAAAPVKVDLPSGTYEIDPAHASITWRVMHFGLSNYTARFTKFTSTVNLDAANVAKSTLVVTIDPNSVRTDYPFADKTDFDKEIAQDERFLNGAQFPQIKFVSTGIVATGPKTGKLTGNLTLRGITKPVTLDAKWNGGVASHPFLKIPVFGISATGTIKRSDFGMTYGAQALSDTVELQIEAEYQKAK